MTFTEYYEANKDSSNLLFKVVPQRMAELKERAAGTAVEYFHCGICRSHAIAVKGSGANICWQCSERYEAMLAALEVDGLYPRDCYRLASLCDGSQFIAELVAHDLGWSQPSAGWDFIFSQLEDEE